MSFSDHKITQFTHRISELADQPNLPADELKARFDSSPEELRQSLNAVCDEGDALTARVDQHDTKISQIAMDKFPNDTIEEKNLHHDLAAKLNAKAEQTALSAETAAREGADSSLGSRLSTAESTLSTHTAQIAQKCQAYIGTYTGNGQASQFINLGFTPKAVLAVMNGCSFADTRTAALAVSGQSAVITNGAGTFYAMQLESNGFRVYYNSGTTSILLNSSGAKYLYVALQ